MTVLDGQTFHHLIGTQGEVIGWSQMSLRAALIFAIGLAIMRFAAARAFGKWTALDIILAVIVGSNLSRALTGSAPFWPTIIATLVIVALHAALSHAVVRWPILSRALKGRPVCLIKAGTLDKLALRRHGIGEGDLRMALRAQGVAQIEDAETVYLERNGDISVITKSR
ncbi:MAG: DUF421 domain-containing protein [Brevundimonas sp.]|uniref:DUF421 domain-containing protein n=1 Tax=Brevundimonas sp. TaxID=1871086 RepID=UPI003919CEF1